MYRREPLVIVPRMAAVCKECGCSCNSCFNSNSLEFHHEIEELRSHLRQKESHIAHMEQEFMESKTYAEQEISKLQDELAKLRDRYERLFDSHKKLQKINAGLEDKLLQVVNKFENEKINLQKDIATLTSKMVDVKATICDLEEENERYRNDCNYAVQLLQCKPSAFVAHRLSTLPVDLQDRVKGHLSQDQLHSIEENMKPQVETKVIRVPMPTFPPTAMVYSVNKIQEEEEVEKKPRVDTVPMTLIAKVLTQPEPKRKPRRTYICTKCKNDLVFFEKSVQTDTVYSHNGSIAIFSNVHRPRLDSTETEIN